MFLLARKRVLNDHMISTIAKHPGTNFEGQHNLFENIEVSMIGIFSHHQLSLGGNTELWWIRIVMVVAVKRRRCVVNLPTTTNFAAVFLLPLFGNFVVLLNSIFIK